jgi:SecD/SecF fusion protein
MSLRQRSLMFILVVLGLLAASIVVIVTKPTVLGLDLKGGAQVILQASPTANAEVNDDSMRRAINVIRNRVDAFGVSEPEIQKQGTSQISVALPAVEDPAVILDLVKPAQLNFYAFQPNLVDYQRYPAPPSTLNPPEGTTDLYGLIQLAKRTEPKSDAQRNDNVYLFRNDKAHTFVAGPSTSIDELVKRLEANPDTQAVAAEYKANKKAFDVQVLPKGFVILTNGEGAGSNLDQVPLCGEPGGRCVLMHDVVGVSGSEVKSANLGFDAANNPTVQMQFTGAGRKKFAEITKQIVDGAIGEGRPCASSNDSSCFWNFAISLDNVIISSPYVSYKDNPSGIDSDSAEISGGFTESSARTLADQLSSGAIPIKLDAVSTSTVSATLGEQSLRQGLIAGIAGLLIVMLALIAYYRVLGVIASLTLIIYGIYFWALAKLIPIALTLPGIAGLILTIGVAADASVVIFERVREESRAGRPPRSAILNGYKRGITAIIDANIVTLVTAVFIFLLSTAGPRGFAFTLILGVLISLFTAVVATQGAFGLLVDTKLFRNEKLMGLNVREINWKMDVVGRWKLWLGISFFPLLLGVLIIGLRGLEPGLDFKSGTEVRVAWAQTTATENGIRDQLQALGINDPKIQKYTPQGQAGKLSGFEIQTETLDAAKTSQVLDQLSSKFGTIDEQQITSVGPTFGRDIVRNAIWAIVFSFLAIIIYLTIRFEYKLAIPAMASVVHDVWLALAIYSIAGKEVTGATVAALLTILGYSLYDVVILFDRIRENMPLMRGRPYRDIVNRSVHETLTRSIITMVLTLLPITCLLLFGGETLADFSFALFVGILSGGVSSIFISAPLAALWKEQEPDARRARARSERKAARAAMVDADIMDVEALARAERALAVSDRVAEDSEFVEMDDTAAETAAPNGRLEVEAEAAGEPAGDGAEGPEPSEELAPQDEPAPVRAPKPPPDRQRRHRNVQRKRRR